MKFVKKLTALFLAVVMTMAMGITVFADETETKNYTITVPAGDTHQYEIYQILTGDLSTDETTLSNVVAGQNFKGTDAKAAADALAAIDANATDSAKLETIESYVDLTGNAFASVTGDKDSAKTVTVPAGYYLIKDKDGSLSGEDDAYTTYVVVVVKNYTIARKADQPTVEKKVKDVNDSDSAQSDNGIWQDSADHDVNDTVEFKLTATLPDDAKDFAAYKSYKLVFHDVESQGLTFDSNSVVVKYGDSTLTAGQYTLNTAPSDGCTFEVTIADVKSLDGINVAAGGKFTVEYSATLNDQAVIGSTGNPNEVYLEYSNNPNYEGTGEEDTGKTPKDKVIVFTYQVDVNKVTKVNDVETPLAGAGFTLYKWVLKQDSTTEYEWKQIGNEILATETASGSYTSSFLRVDDGNYKLVETTVPDGYNKIADVEFAITATHDQESANPQLLTLTGGDKFTGNVSTGVLSGSIENTKGSVLPSTGGMGTTVIYIAGIAMIVAAGVVVIARKRMA